MDLRRIVQPRVNEMLDSQPSRDLIDSNPPVDFLRLANEEPVRVHKGGVDSREGVAEILLIEQISNEE